MKTIAKKIYLALICIILYAPIVTLIVHNTDHCIALCTDCNIDRYLCRTWHAGNEFKNAYSFYGNYKHPYAECRYRNRSIPDASLHCIPLHTWIQNNPFGTYYIQHTLCHLKCNAKIKTDEP